MRAIVLFVMLCGCLFVYGFLLTERVRITVQKSSARSDLNVVVTVKNVMPEMHTIFMEACAADMAEDGVMFCQEDGWYMNSAHPMRMDQNQYPFPLRNVPRGWLMFSAAVLDFDGKTLASGETRMVR